MCQLSRIIRESPVYRVNLPFSRTGDQNLAVKKKFGSVAHKKLRFKLHMSQNSKIIWLLMLVLRFLASFSYVMHVVRCKQK